MTNVLIIMPAIASALSPPGGVISLLEIFAVGEVKIVVPVRSEVVGVTHTVVTVVVRGGPVIDTWRTAKALEVVPQLVGSHSGLPFDSYTELYAESSPISVISTVGAIFELNLVNCLRYSKLYLCVEGFCFRREQFSKDIANK